MMYNNENNGGYQNNGYAQNNSGYQNNGYAQNNSGYQNNGYAQNNSNYSNNGYKSDNSALNNGNDFVEKSKRNNREKDSGKKNGKKILYQIGKYAIIGGIIVKLVFQVMRIFPKCYGFSSPAAAVFVLSIFTLIPMGLLIKGWKYFILAKESAIKSRGRCTQIVEAKLVDYKEVITKTEDGTSTSYYAIYDFSFNNQKYHVTSRFSYFGMRFKMIGCKLLINPDDPYEIYEIENEHDDIIMSRKVGIVFMVVGAVFFYLFTF